VAHHQHPQKQARTKKLASISSSLSFVVGLSPKTDFGFVSGGMRISKVAPFLFTGVAGGGEVAVLVGSDLTVAVSLVPDDSSLTTWTLLFPLSSSPPRFLLLPRGPSELVVFQPGVLDKYAL